MLQSEVAPGPSDSSTEDWLLRLMLIRIIVVIAQSVPVPVLRSARGHTQYRAHPSECQAEAIATFILSDDIFTLEVYADGRASF